MVIKMKSVNYSAYIGLDVHRDIIADVTANSGLQREVRFYGNISSAKDSVIRLMKKLIKIHGSILASYEAGLTGYDLYRLLLNMNIDCTVVTSSRIPKISTNEIKNDDRDTIVLARLLRTGGLECRVSLVAECKARNTAESWALTFFVFSHSIMIKLQSIKLS